MRKLVQKIACKTKKLAQLEKISTDGVSRVSIFFHLWPECYNILLVWFTDNFVNLLALGQTR